MPKLDHKSRIALFFESPVQHREPPGHYSTLYLLRRDIAAVLGDAGAIGGSIASTGQPRAVFLGAIGILAGVDLLAKFYSGNDTGNVGPRFKNFVKKYFRLTESDQNVVYQLRNALVHSFGLYSEDRGQRSYHFLLVWDATLPLIDPQQSDGYLVNVQNLYIRWEEAIEMYRNDLGNGLNTSLQTNFDVVYKHYGSIDIGPRSAP